MSMPFFLLLTPLLTAGIGWATNWLAIKMLFRPRIPINCMGLRFLDSPKRHAEPAGESAEIWKLFYNKAVFNQRSQN